MDCSNCGKRMEHNERYCPLFPDVEPPEVRHYFPGSAAFTASPGVKWGTCHCLIHTCSMHRLSEVSPSTEATPSESTEGQK